MHSKIKLKNQVCSPKTRRAVAKKRCNLGKENAADVSIVQKVNRRRRDAIKPLQKKNNTVEDKIKGKEKECSKVITVVQTEPIISHITTRNMRERRKLDHSENRICLKKNVNKQQKENSQKAAPKILSSSNIATRKKVTVASGIENEPPPTESPAKKANKAKRKTSTRRVKIAENSSTKPVYKEKLDDNMNTTVDRVFDFESNSEEIAETSDDSMKDIIEKLVRENKAVVIHKPRRRKASTDVKEIVTKERVPHSELKQNYVKKLLSSISEVTKPRKKPTPKAICKTTATASETNIEPFLKPQGSTQVDSVNKSTDTIKSVKRTQMQEENKDSENMTEIVDLEDWTGTVESDVESIVDLEDVATSSCDEPLTPPRPISKTYSRNEESEVASIVDSEDAARSSSDEPLTPPRPIFKTYSRKSKASSKPQCQSTPLLLTTNSLTSPWRSDEELLNSSTINFEFSKIGQFDETSIDHYEGKSFEKIWEELRRSTVNHGNKCTVLSNIMIKPAEEKPISEDIKNCFGFISDDDDEEITGKETMSEPISRTSENFEDSLPSINLSIVETVKERHRAKKPLVDNCEISKKQTPKILQESKTTTAKQSCNFANIKDRQTTKKQINQVRKKKFSPKRNGFRKLLSLHQPNEITQKLSSTDSSYDVPVLFETNWPTREDEKHRSYTRVPQQKYKSIMKNDETVIEDTTLQRSHRKTKAKKDSKFEEEMKKFAEEFNANCKEIENYNLVVEVSK